MDRILHKLSDAELATIGAAGKARVKREFSDIKMAERLDGIIDSMAQTERRSVREILFFSLTFVAIAFDYAYYIALSHITPTKRMGRLRTPPFALTALCAIAWIGYWTIAYREKRKARQQELAQRKGR